MAITIQSVVYKDRFTVEPGQAAAVRATGTGAAAAPAVVGGATSAAVTGVGTGAAGVPVVTGVSPGNVNAVRATGTATAAAPTVTGIRNDPYVKAYKRPAVEEKSAAVKGQFLHPELYGLPAEFGMDYRAR